MILAAESTPLIVALLAVVAAPLIGYITATRKLSGKIATSEAGSLWEESRSIREDYRQRLVESNARIATLETRVGLLEARNNELMRENIRLTAKLATALEERRE